MYPVKLMCKVCAICEFCRGHRLAIVHVCLQSMNIIWNAKHPIDKQRQTVIYLKCHGIGVSDVILMFTLTRPGFAFSWPVGIGKDRLHCRSMDKTLFWSETVQRFAFWYKAWQSWDLTGCVVFCCATSNRGTFAFCILCLQYLHLLFLYLFPR